MIALLSGHINMMMSARKDVVARHGMETSLSISP